MTRYEAIYCLAEGRLTFTTFIKAENETEAKKQFAKDFPTANLISINEF